MTGSPDISLVPIGRVESPLTDAAEAPKQGFEGGPDAWLVFEPRVLEALDGARARRSRDRAHLARPRRPEHAQACTRATTESNPLRGVFGTRSADRPNPIGLHEVEVLAVEGNRVRVSDLEALDGTPVVDLKPVIYRTRG